MNGVGCGELEPARSSPDIRCGLRDGRSLRMSCKDSNCAAQLNARGPTALAVLSTNEKGPRDTAKALFRDGKPGIVAGGASERAGGSSSFS
jgi:hypothetical protein